ncbi:MAG: hypothetical protein HY720_10495 [Planctomycetes bacterium]|nr:hypothetical protein [Planctomycetota bacterium]
MRGSGRGLDLAIAALVFLVSLLVFPGTRHLPSATIDDCNSVLGATRVLHGEWPHESFMVGTLTPGLLPFALSFVFRIFEPDLRSLGFLLLALGSGIASFLYLAARQIGPRPLALLVALSICVVGIANSYGLMASWFPLLFGAIALWRLLAGLPRPSAGSLYVVGALCGASFLFKQTCGVFHLLATLVTLGTSILAEGPTDRQPRRGVAVLGVLAAPGVFVSVGGVLLAWSIYALNFYVLLGLALAPALWFSIRAAVSGRPYPAAREIFSPLLRTTTGFLAVVTLHIGVLWIRGGTPLLARFVISVFILPGVYIRPSANVYNFVAEWRKGILLAILVAGFAAAAWAGKRLRRPERFGALLAAGIVLAHLSLFLPLPISLRLRNAWLPHTWEFLHVLPVGVLTAVFALAIGRVAQGVPFTLSFHRLQGAAIFAAFHILLLWPSEVSAYLLPALPPVFVVAGGLLAMPCRGDEAWGVRRVLSSPAYVLALGVWVSSMGAFLTHHLVPHAQAGEADRIYVDRGNTRAYFQEDDARMYLRLDDARRRYVADGEAAIFFNLPGLYLMSGCSNPTRSVYIWEGLYCGTYDSPWTSHLVVELVDALRDGPVKIVIVRKRQCGSLVESIRVAIDERYVCVDEVEDCLFFLPRAPGNRPRRD